MTEDDYAFWREQCLPSFSSLLRSTGSYTPEQTESHINFFKEHVIPHIGPRPTSGGAYLMAHTGSVLENSINFSDTSDPVIRFIFQPMGIKGIPEATNADVGWFHQTSTTFCLTEPEMALIKEKVPSLSSIPQFLIGFDLDKEDRTLKAYYCPLYKSIIDGSDTDQMIYDLVRRLTRGEKLVPALEKLEKFRRDEPQRAVDCIGIDCIRPEDGARFKLYTRLPESQNSFGFIKHQMTLGGALTDATLHEGLEHLRGIWHLLFDEPEDWTAKDEHKKEVMLEGSPHFGLLLSWELVPGNDAPIPKLYVPLWKFSRSNKDITANYEKIFQKWGWAWGDNGTYSKAIEDA